MLTIVLLFLAGFVSGSINAVAGGGTFVSFGALSLTGIPPIVANATSSIAQLPGYFTSVIAYRRDFAKIWRGALVLAVASVVGSLVGALILLWLDNEQFSAVVPFLLLGATALFAAGPWLKPKTVHEETASRGRNLSSPIVQFITAIYGGFFGAGMGIMMLATLGLTEGGDYHRLNAHQEPPRQCHRHRRDRGLRLRRRHRLGGRPRHGAGRRARRLCRRLGGQARAAGRRPRLRHRRRPVPVRLLLHQGLIGRRTPAKPPALASARLFRDKTGGARPDPEAAGEAEHASVRRRHRNPSSSRVSPSPA